MAAEGYLISSIRSRASRASAAVAGSTWMFFFITHETEELQFFDLQIGASQRASLSLAFEYDLAKALMRLGQCTSESGKPAFDIVRSHIKPVSIRSFLTAVLRSGMIPGGILWNGPTVRVERTYPKTNDKFVILISQLLEFITAIFPKS